MTITDHSDDWLDKIDDGVFLCPEVAKPEYQHAIFTLKDRASWLFWEWCPKFTNFVTSETG